MDANFIEERSKAYASQRSELWRIVPMDLPFTLSVTTTDVCNFQCYYCSHGRSHDLPISSKGQMKKHVFEQCMGNLGKYGKLKLLALAGMGEPLINPDLPDMVRFAKENSLADNVSIITNASLLTPAIADALIEAGVDEMRISLQGLDAQQYYETSNVKIDYAKFLDGLRYLYENKGNTVIYIKIIDAMLKTQADKEKFIALFQPLADIINIESLIPISDIFDAAHASGNAVRAGQAVETDSCPLPFYSPILTQAGDLYSCCSPHMDYWGGARLGNLLDEDFGEIWNKGLHRKLCLDLLNGRRNSIPECSGCTHYKFQSSPIDYLDGHEQEIIDRFGDDG